MTHFGTTVRVKATDVMWLKTGSQVGQLVNEWSDRTDIIAYVSDTAGEEAKAPAAFNPRTAEVDVNTKYAFGFATPEQVGDLTDRAQQFEFPKATGAIFHEAMHAKFSTWSLESASEELSTSEFEAMMILEESRIERYGVMLVPKNKSFLRSCALELVLTDTDTDGFRAMSSTRQAAHTMALSYARVDAGVLTPDDLIPIRPVVEKIVSEKTRGALRDIWIEFQSLRAEHDTIRMYELAREWDKTVTEAATENGETETSEPSESSQEFAQMLSDALLEAAEEAGYSAMGEVSDQQTQESYDEALEKANTSSAEKGNHKKVAGLIYGRGTGPASHQTNSRLYETRKPTPEERVSAVKISQALEKAKYRDRVRIESASVTPPGRLRTRALVQGQALKERGVMQQAEPWNRVQRKHTEDPNLTIGVMVDISGSMSSAMKPMASAAWILSEAGKRIQAQTSMVYYGNAVFPTLKAGQHLEDVKVFTAEDGTEKFDDGFKALDGSLDLLHGSGARLLVIVSDGEYVRDEQIAARKWLKRCQQAGVGVLWIGAGHYGGNAEARYGGYGNAVFTKLGDKVTDVANEIGEAASKALTMAGATRA
jgi:hypothetical protein